MTAGDPVLVYDGDCGVCTRSAKWLAERSEISLLAFAELDEAHIDRLPSDWRQCAHLFVDGRRYSCGSAMERAFLMTDHSGTGVLDIVSRLPGYGHVREFGYRHFVHNRGKVGQLLERTS